MLTLTLAAALLLPPSEHRGDELKTERLPTDVDLVLHLDLETLKRTELWRMVQESCAEEISAEIDELEELKTRYGIDPLTDLRALTVYKLSAEEEPTVALLTTNGKIEQALRELQREPSYRTVRDSGIELHAWQDPEGHEGESVYAYVHALPNGDRVTAVASKPESAVQAARVLRGEERSHASGGALQIAPVPGSFLYVAASTIPGLDDFTPASHVFGLAQGIQVDLGEAGGLLRAHLGVVTASVENARNIVDVVRGLVALGSLAGAEAEPVVEFLRGVRVQDRGPEVLVDVEIEVGRLRELIESELEEEELEQEEEDEVRVEKKRR